MISKEWMIPLLVEASPEFRSRWEAIQHEWADETSPPYYLALADFARHISQLLRSKNDTELKRIFAVVEQLLLDGDDFVRKAATVGLLEGLQNKNLHTDSTPDQVVPYLQPNTLKWWEKVEAFWTRGVVITDD